MTLQSMHPNLREALCVMTILRNSGFTRDEIFALVVGGETLHAQLAVHLKSQGKEWTMIVGSIREINETFSEEWRDAVQLWNKLSKKEVLTTLRKSRIFSEKVGMFTSLLAKGFKLTAPALN